MTQTVFFDLDGTLTDPMLGITGSIRYALEKLGATAPDAQELTWCIGATRKFSDAGGQRSSGGGSRSLSRAFFEGGPVREHALLRN